MAWYGAAAGIGASLGLVIGGALTSAVSWRAGFFINVPIGVAMIVLAPRYLPETERGTGRFDLVGASVITDTPSDVVSPQDPFPCLQKIILKGLRESQMGSLKMVRVPCPPAFAGGRCELYD